MNRPVTYTLQKGRSGFTLIEFILYIAISTSLMLVVSLFLGTLLQSRVKNQVIAEVEQQGLYVTQLITQTVRNAEGIILPLQGSNGQILTLDVQEITNDPTLFDSASETIRITEGISTPVPLTNARVSVSSLLFENISYAGTPGIIRFSFTLSHKNPENKIEFEYEKTFYASAALRPQ